MHTFVLLGVIADESKVRSTCALASAVEKYYIFSPDTIETLAKLKRSLPPEAHSTCTYSKYVRLIVNNIKTK